MSVRWCTRYLLLLWCTLVARAISLHNDTDEHALRRCAVEAHHDGVNVTLVVDAAQLLNARLSVAFSCDSDDMHRDRSSTTTAHGSCDVDALVLYEGVTKSGWHVARAARYDELLVVRHFRVAELRACSCAGEHARVPAVAAVTHVDGRLVYSALLALTAVGAPPSVGDTPKKLLLAQTRLVTVDIDDEGSVGVCQRVGGGGGNARLDWLDAHCERATQTPYFVLATRRVADDTECASLGVVDAHAEPQLAVDAARTLPLGTSRCAHALVPLRGSLDNGVFRGTKLLSLGHDDNATLAMHVTNPCNREMASERAASVRALVYKDDDFAHPCLTNEHFVGGERVALLLYTKLHTTALSACNRTTLHIDRVSIDLDERTGGDAPRRVVVYDARDESDGARYHSRERQFGECASERVVSWDVDKLLSHTSLFRVAVEWTATSDSLTLVGSASRRDGVPDRYSPHAATLFGHRLSAAAPSAHKRSVDTDEWRRDTESAIRVAHRRRVRSAGLATASGMQKRSTTHSGTTHSEYTTVCLRGYHYVESLRYCVRDYTPQTYSNLSFWIIACMTLVCVLLLYVCQWCTCKRRRRPRRPPPPPNSRTARAESTTSPPSGSAEPVGT